MSRFTLLALLIGSSLAGAVNAADEPKAALNPDAPDHAAKMAKGLELFKKEVRPVLIGRCVKCHGGEETEGDFDLTTREALMRGGVEGKSVVVGRAQASRLYRLINHEDDPNMPEDGAKLADLSIAAIGKWIDLGAPYDKPLIEKEEDPLAWTRRTIDSDARKFWSLQPLKLAAPPRLENDSWSQTDVDRFVLAALREHKLSPNAPSTRRRLIRRAYFDLIGLPPTPDEVNAFVNDQDPLVYEKLIDHLLESPHYGERWGRHWLDIARFAESHGFEQDYDRPHAYHYRDFVIQALNQDMPYDQFVGWQLAGDEIAPDNPLAMMATGFMGAGVFPTQLTEKEFEPARYDELADMVGTMGTAMLGMTIGCARCHDHKFDPIPQRDFYQLASAFGATIRSEIELDLNAATSEELAKWQKQRDPLVATLQKFEQTELPARFDAWLKDRPQEKLKKATWTILDFVESKSHGGATLTKLDDGSLLAAGTNPDFDKYTLVAHTNQQGITAIRLEALSHGSMVRSGPGRATNGNMGLGNFSAVAQPLTGDGKPITIKLANPKATFQQNTGNLSIAASIDGDAKTGWAVDPQFGKDHAAVFQTATDIGFEGGTKLTFTLEFNVNNKHNIGRPRLSISTSPRPVGLEENSQQQQVVEILAKLQQSGGELSKADRDSLFMWYRSIDPEWRKLNQQVQTHLNAKPKPALTKVMVASEGFKPIKHHADGRGFPHFYKDTHFLRRGDATQKQGVAPVGFLQALTHPRMNENTWLLSPPEGWRTSYRRRSLANWISDTEYGAGQQLARVIVNRLWQHHLGRGIVASPNDFGYQGQRPTHPALLDWLAQRLIDNEWRLKSLHKLIMTSAVYTQSAAFDEAAAKTDLDNRWFWRRNPQRLEAEVIRDAMLTVGDQLDRRMFGAGTLDEGMKRRSIYFMIKRSKLIPMMQIFDSPEPLVSVGDRPSTTIAPQALLFMNSPHVRGYARGFAQRLEAIESLSDAIRQGYMIAVAREPTKDELDENIEFLSDQIASYEAAGGRNAAAVRELALTDFCQVLMCLNEFIYLD